MKTDFIIEQVMNIRRYVLITQLLRFTGSFKDKQTHSSEVRKKLIIMNTNKNL